MTDQKFVFAADRHGRDVDQLDDGGIYVSAGDEIYSKAREEAGDSIEDFESGIYGMLGDQENPDQYVFGEIDQAFSELSEKYEEVHLGLGNHEAHILSQLGILPDHLRQVASKYSNVEIAEDEIREIEGRKFYFDRPYQSNEVDGYPNRDISAKKLGYEEDDLEEAADYLGKDEEDVSYNDIEGILNGEVQVESENAGTGVREMLEGLPYVGGRVFVPLYETADRVKDKMESIPVIGNYFASSEDSSSSEEVPSLEKTEEFEQYEEAVNEYENQIDAVVSEIDDLDEEVTYVGHGQPRTDDNPNGSIRTRDILDKSENVSAAYTGHFHNGFEGETEKEISGVKVINPMEGYTVDDSGGKLESYDTYQFEGDRRVEGEPMSEEDLPEVSAQPEEGRQGTEGETEAA